MARARGLLLAGLLAGVTLGACGSTAHPSAHAPTSTTPPSACPTSSLAVEIGVAGTATGHVGQEIRFRNTSTSACTLRGYPRLQMLDAHGRDITTRLHFGSGYVVPDLPVRTVTLRAHGSAGFLIGYEDATGYGTATCPTSSRIRVTPPGNSSAITITWHLTPYGGPTIARLRCGEINVSPVEPVSLLH